MQTRDEVEGLHNCREFSQPLEWFDVHTGYANTGIKMWFRGLYFYRQWVRFITLFPNIVFLLQMEVEQFCKIY